MAAETLLMFQSFKSMDATTHGGANNHSSWFMRFSTVHREPLSGRSTKNGVLSNHRLISTGQLHVLPRFHLRPINLVVYKGSYFVNRMGDLILRSASRLDAFSVYPLRTWLPSYAVGTTTDSPLVRPSRSSRTKDSSSQISCAHDG